VAIDLESVLPQSVGTTAYYVIGTVVNTPAVSSMISVNIHGTVVILPHLQSYIPAVNDSCMIMVQGTQRIVIGAVTNPSMPTGDRGLAPLPSQAIPGTPISPVPSQADVTRTFVALSTGDWVSTNTTLLFDQFNGLDNWLISSGGDIVNGQFRMVASNSWYNAMARQSPLGNVIVMDFTGSTITIRVPQTIPMGVGKNYEQILFIENSVTGNRYEFMISGSDSNINARDRVSGTYHTYGISPYSSTDHQWIRISESGGMMRWWTSPNNLNWTLLAETTVSFSLSSMFVYLTCGHDGSVPDSYGYWDDCRIDVPSAVGQWRTDTKQPHMGNPGDGLHTGTWFYGQGINTALDGATISSAKIYLRRAAGGVYTSVAPTLYLVTQGSQPEAGPTLIGSPVTLSPIPYDSEGWFDLPLSFVQQFSNGGAFGIACHVPSANPFIAFSSLAERRQSGALQLTYNSGVPGGGGSFKYGQVFSQIRAVPTVSVVGTVSSNAQIASFSTVKNGTTIVKPSGTSTDDVLIAIHYNDTDGSLGAMTAPAGWALATNGSYTGSSGFVKIWWKAVTATEPATYDFTVGAGSENMVILLRGIGINTTTPFLTNPVFASATLPGTVHDAPSVSATAEGVLVCAWETQVPVVANNWTVPSDMVALGDVNQPADWVTAIAAYKRLSANVASGVRTAISSSTPAGTFGNIGLSFILAPSGTGGGGGGTVPGAFMMGASGIAVANGEMDAWLVNGPLQIAGTWGDVPGSQVEQWSTRPGGEYGSWTRALDIAVGAIFKSQGETWANAAAGTYDSRWQAIANQLKSNLGPSTIPGPTGGVAWPLKVATNGHYLVDQNNNPFFYSADTAWVSVSRLTVTDAKRYIDIKAAQGFSALQCSLTVWGRDQAGDKGSPFNGADLTQPNAAYWSDVDQILDYANSRGMLIVLWPLWMADNGGWAGGSAPSTGSMSTYGTWLGNRYRNRGHIMWALGGDEQYEQISPQIDAIASALNAADANHLITYHPRWDNYNLRTQSWLDWNSIQHNDNNSPMCYELARTGYDLTSPTKPFLNSEPPYYPDTAMGNTTSVQRNRQNGWWSMLGGSMGVVYGGTRYGTWNIGGSGQYDWVGAADKTGLHTGNIGKILTQFHWERLVPDWGSSVVTSSRGTYGSTDYRAVGRASDGSVIAVYLPSGGNVTVALSQLSASGTAQFFDVANGNSVSSVNVNNFGTQVFTPPGNNSDNGSDWVLILSTTAGRVSAQGDGTVTLGARDPRYWFVNFAREMNGGWSDWNVQPGEEANFRTAYGRFQNILKATIPGIKTVLVYNDGTTTGCDTDAIWPSATPPDVLGVDTYNAWPHVTDAAGWTTKINLTEAGGRPAGIETWRQKALSHGVPIAFPEFGNPGLNNGEGGGGGDDPYWLQQMLTYCQSKAGTGAGQVIYAVYFNIGLNEGYTSDYILFAGSSGITIHQPLNSEVFRTIARSVGSVTPPPPPPPPPTTTGFPARAAGIWYNKWEGPILGAFPSDVLGTLNYVMGAFAESSSIGTGSVSFSGYGGYGSDAALKADIEALKARGISVAVSIGGATNNGKTLLQNSTHRSQMLASIQFMVSTYGFNGVDFDMEASNDWTPTEMATFCGQLKGYFGSQFIVGMTMGLYGILGDNWRTAAGLAGNNCDYYCPMLYDFPEAGDSRLTGVAQDKINFLNAGGLSTSKIILGFMLRVNSESYPNASPLNVALSAYQTAKANNPTLRGAFLWEHYRDSRSNPSWPFVRNIGTFVRNG